jgi:hypothetical protein
MATMAVPIEEAREADPITSMGTQDSMVSVRMAANII